MLSEIFKEQIFHIGISTIFAAIPIGIWLYIVLNKNEKSKKTVALVFILGCLTAPILLGIQYFWEAVPSFNLAALIENTIKTQSTMYIATFMLFGAMEEIIKHYVVNTVDRKTLLISTIGDSIKYSLAAALGFSFIENIYYLYEFWPRISVGQLAGMYIFRSIFTTCAHLLFSGIFGYYYGVGKFSIDISKQEGFTGQTSKIAQIIKKIFRIPLSHAYHQHMVVKGLVIAIAMHTFYNYLLQINLVVPIVIFVILGYFYLRYLLNRKAGHLVLATDISTKEKSTLAPKDDTVVMELMGMWFKDKRYADVIHVCERILERDPDNNIIKLFKAKAKDKISDKNVYKKIINALIKTKDDISKKDRNIITKHLEKKDEHEKKAE